ncbi:MAG: tetratricopeptide repeat protein [Mycetocola sp.]
MNDSTAADSATSAAPPSTTSASDWDDRVNAFWDRADDSDTEGTLAAMSALVSERPSTDAAGIYEWASVHDFLGLEAEAIPLYRAAIAAGLDAERHPQAVIQLASSLRNVGELDEAITLLSGLDESAVVGSAAQAFLSLVLHDAGRHAEALQVALGALIPTLPLYRSSLTSYAADLHPHPAR